MTSKFAYGIQRQLLTSATVSVSSGLILTLRRRLFHKKTQLFGSRVSLQSVAVSSLSVDNDSHESCLLL